MKKVNEAVKAALAHVEIAKSRCEAFMYALRGLEEYQRSGLSQAVTAVHTMLYQNLNRAYETLFMWGLFSDEARAEGKKLALSKFLSEKQAIMHFLDNEGQAPGQWLSATEKEFRDDIKSLTENDEKKKA